MLEQGVAGGTLISFSKGANVGTLVAAPVPASFAAVALGAFGLLQRRKR